jgi:hypothetical protein
MTPFEKYLLLQNAILILVTALALILQGRSLLNAIKSIDLLRNQVQGQRQSTRQQALAARAALIAGELSQLDPKHGIKAQNRIAKLAEEFQSAKNELETIEREQGLK